LRLEVSQRNQGRAMGCAGVSLFPAL